MPHPTAAPLPEAMVNYAGATILRLGLDAATPVLMGSAQDWDTAGEPILAQTIRDFVAQVQGMVFRGTKTPL